VTNARTNLGSSPTDEDRAINRSTRGMRTIGMYEVVGGVVGFLTMAWVGTQHPGALPSGSLPLSVAPFATLALVGWLSVRKPSRGRNPSILCQLAQVVAWSAKGVVWKFAAGLYASATFFADRFSLFAGWDTSFLVGVGAPDQPFALTINFVPLCVIVALVRLAPGRSRS
jgi:hypothetical protein